jgi:lipopolysaccharide transport system ATP-binding protein
MPLAIKVENLSKQYRLGQIGTGTLSHDLNRFWASIRGKEDPYAQVGSANDRTQKAVSDYVWALKDINFEIEQGDAVGIIGRNGAGKSTLLKILSRTTLPTTGSVKMKGRIASLLEVGTGFHPEMTGRENIYQNGAILGMTRHEIKSKFDEIVDFSGCEAYIDTPVKRYSSGMYVRLAFAVAAHLESEILIVDEVLAVGDAEFQKKCLGKMNDVAKGEGRTVLFVSHNMAAVKSLCNKGVLLENGRIKTIGSVDDAITRYFKSDNHLANFINYKETHQNEWFKLNEIQIYSKSDDSKVDLDEYDELILKTNIDVLKENEHIKYTYVIKSSFSEPLFTFTHKDIILEKGNNIILCHLPKGFLNIGEYYIDLYIIYKSKDTLYNSNDIFSFKIVEGNRPIGSWMGREPGFIKPNFEWKKI